MSWDLSRSKVVGAIGHLTRLVDPRASRWNNGERALWSCDVPMPPILSAKRHGGIGGNEMIYVPWFPDGNATTWWWKQNKPSYNVRHEIPDQHHVDQHCSHPIQSDDNIHWEISSRAILGNCRVWETARPQYSMNLNACCLHLSVAQGILSRLPYHCHVISQKKDAMGEKLININWMVALANKKSPQAGFVQPLWYLAHPGRQRLEMVEKVLLLQLWHQLCEGTALGVSSATHQNHQGDVCLGDWEKTWQKQQI